MRTLYARWMYDWEDRLCSVSTNRVVRPFDWGLEWTRQLPLAPAPADQDPYTYLNSFNDAALAAPEAFFNYETPRDFRMEGNLLRFTTAAPSPAEPSAASAAQ